MANAKTKTAGKHAKKKILIVDRFAEAALLFLKQYDFLEIVTTESPKISSTDLLGIHGLLIRSRTLVNEELLSKAKQLQVIITCTSGFDHIDLKSTAKWGITVMHTPEANVESAAELTVMLALMGVRKYKASQKLFTSKNWNRQPVMGSELQNKNYGIIGFGRIGKRVAEIAKSFNMKIFVNDPYLEEKTFKKFHVAGCSLEEIFENCDVVSVHVPKTGRTLNLIDENILSQIRGEIILINTSRGGVINERALVQACARGSIASAAVDVFQEEPLDPSSELLKSEKIITTPHIGANTFDAIEKSSLIAAKMVVGFFQDGSTSETLPPKEQWYFEETSSSS